MYYETEFSLINVIYEELIQFPMTYIWHANLSTNYPNIFQQKKSNWREICLTKPLVRHTTETNNLHIEHCNFHLIKFWSNTSYNSISLKDIPFQLWYHWDDVTVQSGLHLCSHQTPSAEYQARHFPFLSRPVFQGRVYLNFSFFKARIPPLEGLHHDEIQEINL